MSSTATFQWSFTNDSVFGLLIGFLIGMAVAAMFFSPWIGVAFARLVSVLTIAAGVALMVWGILCLAGVSEFLLPFPYSPIRTSTEAIAWGGGLLAAGAVATVFAFLKIQQD